jgi:hypothetical protein
LSPFPQPGREPLSVTVVGCGGCAAGGVDAGGLAD